MSLELSENYDRSAFLGFAVDLLPEFIRDVRPVAEQITNFDVVSLLGVSTKLDLPVFEVRVSGSLSKRISLATDAFKLMKVTASYRALIVFHSGSTNEWRLSLMTSTPTVEAGKVTTRLSNPRRFSYLLGPGSKTVTPYRFLVKNGRVQSFEDLQNRFSVEVVNGEFYKGIAQLYDRLVGSNDVAPMLKFPEAGEESHQFAVRLIGRIVFCWFLREKRSANGNPLIRPEILSSSAAKDDHYYHRVLAPLFFEILNKPLDRRVEAFQTGFSGEIPYLNGGLFSPQYDDYYKFDQSRGQSEDELVDVPDEWIRSLFDLLETYNFTVDENTSVDIDLSIDPEMLGRIFENLLARINPETGETVRKSTGSFYTPREIVEYMVDECLVQHLMVKTDVSEQKLRALITYDLSDDAEYPLNAREMEQAVKALSQARILDPACGSGAFPIGVLQKIVFMLQRIDPDAKLWFENQISNTPPEVRKLIEREFANRNFDYIRKLGIIRECIFGVDIQPIATEIARLRCFLTLIVDERVRDEEPNRGVYPLPNLDFKFVTANTLINLNISGGSRDVQAGLFEDQAGIDELKELRADYFNSHNSERDSLKLQFSQTQNRMLQKMIANHSHGFSETTKSLSTWDPFGHKATDWFDCDWMFGITGGFDIVIANPPYVRQESYTEYKDQLKLAYPTIYDGRADLYTYFIKLGFDLLSAEGTLAFITSNKYLVRGYGSKIRKFLARDTVVEQLINFGELPVFKASVDSAIIVAKRRATSSHRDGTLRFVQAKTPDDISNVRDLFVRKHNSIPHSELSDEVWVLEEPVKLLVLEKVKQFERTLGSTCEIFGGIKTGLDEAFVISAKTRDDLLQQDPASSELIKPWFKGREVKKWFAHCEQYIIYIPQNRIQIEEYPAIMAHLLPYREKLNRRATSQKWFELQQPQERFTKLFEGPKIIYSEIAKEMRAFKDSSKAYGTMKMFFIPYDPVVLAILNSSLFDWYARMTFSSLGDPWNGGRLEFKSMYMSKLPLPPLIGSLQEEIAELVELIEQGNAKSDVEDRLNELVFDLYGLSSEEIKIVRGN